jgi:hypothetical protein
LYNVHDKKYPYESESTPIENKAFISEESLHGCSLEIPWTGTPLPQWFHFILQFHKCCRKLCSAANSQNDTVNREIERKSFSTFQLITCFRHLFPEKFPSYTVLHPSALTGVKSVWSTQSTFMYENNLHIQKKISPQQHNLMFRANSIESGNIKSRDFWIKRSSVLCKKHQLWQP